MVPVSLENIVTDVHELEKGMDIVRKEHELRGKERQSVILRDFLSNSEEKLRKLKADSRIAQESFKDCVEFFGESPRTTDANTFFSLLVRFTRSFKVTKMNFGVAKKYFLSTVFFINSFYLKKEIINIL